MKKQNKQNKTKIIICDCWYCRCVRFPFYLPFLRKPYYYSPIERRKKIREEMKKIKNHPVFKPEGRLFDFSGIQFALVEHIHNKYQARIYKQNKIRRHGYL